MDALYNLVFACFVILIMVNIFFYILAANNTVEGEEYSPHGLNVHKLFSKSSYILLDSIDYAYDRFILFNVNKYLKLSKKTYNKKLKMDGLQPLFN